MEARLAGRVRTARRQDVPALADLRSRYLAERSRRAAVHFPPAQSRERLEPVLAVWLEQPGRLLLVAEMEGGILQGYAMGAVGNRSVPLRARRVGEILETFAIPEARGRGIDGQLVDLLSSMLRHRGAETIALHLAAPEETELTYWQDRGFSALQVVMARRLNAG